MTFKVEVFQNGSLWRVANTKDVGTIRNQWWYIPRILNIPLDEYVKKLKDEFNAEDIQVGGRFNCLTFGFRTLMAAEKYALWVNRKMRKKI